MIVRIVAQQVTSSIRARMGRNAVTVVGIALAIAFAVGMQARPESTSDDARRWLVNISLFMSFVGISNSMFISVSERIREIGTLKCLGASDGLVVWILLVEAMVVGVAGSLAGALVGGIIGWLAFGSFETSYVASSAVLGVGITMVAALIPTYQASKLPAASALRVEV